MTNATFEKLAIIFSSKLPQQASFFLLFSFTPEIIHADMAGMAKYYVCIYGKLKFI